MSSTATEVLATQPMANHLSSSVAAASTQPSPFRRALNLIAWSPKAGEKSREDEDHPREEEEEEKSEAAGPITNGGMAASASFPLNFDGNQQGRASAAAGGMDDQQPQQQQQPGDALAQLMANFAAQAGVPPIGLLGHHPHPPPPHHPHHLQHQQPHFGHHLPPDFPMAAAFLAAHCAPPPPHLNHQNHPHSNHHHQQPPSGPHSFGQFVPPPHSSGGQFPGCPAPPVSSNAAAPQPQMPPPFPFPLDAASLAALQPFMVPPEHRRKNATREVTAPLKHWLNEHRKNPYPTKAEKTMLAVITRMTMTQVSTWFANARRRLKKENKMTWSPRHRPNDEDDDDEDGEGVVGGGGDGSVEIMANQQRQQQSLGEGPSGSSSPLDEEEERKETEDEERRRRRRMKRANKRRGGGIWSIADTLAENGADEDDEDEDEDEGERECERKRKRSSEKAEDNEVERGEAKEEEADEKGPVPSECHPQFPDAPSQAPPSNGHDLVGPPMDGLFPAALGAFGLPPHIALSLGLPPFPDPNILFALAAHQHQQQQNGGGAIFPGALGGPPPQRLLPLNPFMLLAQQLALANPPLPMPAALKMTEPAATMMTMTNGTENGSIQLPSSAAFQSAGLPPLHQSNNHQRHSPPGQPHGQKRSAIQAAKSDVPLEGLPMAKRHCRTQS